MAEPDSFYDGEGYVEPVDPLDPDEQKSIQDQFKEAHDKAHAEAGVKNERLVMAYRRLFEAGKPQDGDVEVVMQDLATFCRGFASTFHPDPNVHAMLSGRSEVFHRIMKFSRLDYTTLMKYHVKTQTEG